MSDPYDLERFIRAQEPVYAAVLSELRAGRKQTHWMWFIFPQYDGLGFSSTTKYYAIKSPQEAREYLRHPLLGARLQECCGLVLAARRGAAEMFGYPDDLKLKSSMTLFEAVSQAPNAFSQVLEQCFGGGRDQRTLDLLKGAGERSER